jgi:type IV pilus assembly protein PilQ
MVAQKTKTRLTFITALAILLVAAGAWAGGNNEIRGITFEEAGGATKIRVRGSQTGTFSVYRLERPSRVVVDIAQASLATSVAGSHDAGAIVAPNTWSVSQVTAQPLDDEGALIRVAVTLARPGSYDVKSEGKDIVITVTARDVAPKTHSPEELQRAQADADMARKEREQAKKAQAIAEDARKQSEDEAARARAKAMRAESELATALIEAARAKDAATSAEGEADRLRQQATSAAGKSSPSDSQSEKQLRDARAEAARATELAAAAQADAERARAEAARTASDAIRARQQVSAAAQQVERARREVERLNAEAVAIRAQANHEADTMRREASADAQQTRNAAVADAERARREALVDAEKVKAQAAADAERARQQAASAARDADRVKNLATAEAAQARAAAEKAAAEAERTRRQLEAAATEVHRLKGALAEQADQAARDHAAADKAKREAVQTAEEARTLKQQAEQFHADATRVREEARAELQRARQEVEAVRQAAERAKSDVDAQRRQSDAEKRRVEAERNLAIAERKELEASRGRLELDRKSAQQDRQQVEQVRAEATRMMASARARLTEAETLISTARAAEAKATKGQKEAMSREQIARDAEAQARRDREAAQAAALKATRERDQSTSLATAERQRLEQAVRSAEERLRETERAKSEAEETRRSAEVDAASARRDAERARLAVAAATEEKQRMELAAREAAKAKVVTQSLEAVKVASVRAIDFHGDQELAEISVDFIGKATTELVKASASRAEFAIDGASLPANLEKKLDVKGFGSVVQSVSSFQDRSQPNRISLVVELNGSATPTIEKDGDRVSIRFAGGRVATRSQTMPRPVVGGYGASSAPVAQKSVAQVSSASRKKVYRGPTLDLDIRDASIHDILRTLSEVGRVNIVVPDSVKDTVTVRMKRVPWDQALDVILSSKGYWYRKEGNLYRVAPRKQLDEEDELEEQRRQLKLGQEDPEPEVMTLNYASADEISKKLVLMLSPKGKIEVDERTNSLIVNDVRANRSRISELAQRLDTQTPQILIEARVVEARSAYKREIGIQWGGNASASAQGGNATGLIFPSSVNLIGGSGIGSTGVVAPSDFAVNLPAAAGAGAGGAMGVSLGSVGGNFNINLRLSALEANGTVRIISSPKITVLNNTQATISQGVSIPITVVSDEGAQTRYVPADLSLIVKPYVSQKDCSIAMDLTVTKNEPDFVNTGSRGDPTILRKEAKTKILVADGETSVMGGVYTRNTGVAYAKVPFFGDLPVLGWLFKNRKENDDRTELLIFITPKITNKAFLRCQ